MTSFHYLEYRSNISWFFIAIDFYYLYEEILYPEAFWYNWSKWIKTLVLEFNLREI